MDPDLRPPAAPLDYSSKDCSQHITLSDPQKNQIREIFELFDTDGGGSIDRKELEFAMNALGFQNQDSDIYNLKINGKKGADSTSTLLEVIAGDGKVSLEEFMALMTGEVLGRNQYEEAQTVFAALCKSDGQSEHDNLITLGKLEAACRQFEVYFLPSWSTLSH